MRTSCCTSIDLPTTDLGVSLLNVDSGLGPEPLHTLVVDELLDTDGSAVWIRTTLAFWREVLEHRAQRVDTPVAPTTPASAANGSTERGVPSAQVGFFSQAQWPEPRNRKGSRSSPMRFCRRPPVRVYSAIANRLVFNAENVEVMVSRGPFPAFIGGTEKPRRSKNGRKTVIGAWLT